MPNAGLLIRSHNGVSYIYDQARGKMLSMARAYLRAGVSHRRVSHQFMRLEDGQPAMSVGDRVIRPATIVSLSANTETAANWTLEIYKKGTTAPIAALAIAAQSEAGTESLNVDVEESDILLFKVHGTNVPFPRAMLELAWRLPL